MRSFLAAFYRVGPRDTDETHRAYLRQMAGPKTFFMSPPLAKTISFGLDQLAFTPQSHFNRLIWSKQLTLTGRAEMSKEQVSLQGSKEVRAVVKAYVMVRAFAGRLEEKSIRQEVLTSTTWQNHHGGWVLQGFTPPLLKVSSS